MTAGNLPLLFTPITAGKVTFKNRLVVSPMVTVYCDHDGMATDRFIAYHEAKARGGWGVIIVEDYAVEPRGRGYWTPGLWEDEQISSHARLVRGVHKAGAKIIAQIYHAGRQTSSALIGEKPVSSSPVACPVMGEVPRELTKREIGELVTRFGEVALRAKKAGFDGVEVHGAHGYLIAQFMSLYANKRGDEYGGSLVNRLRLPVAIVTEIRKKCGADFLIDFRLSGDEKVRGGRAIEETKAVAMQLERAGVDMLHISAGTYESRWAIVPPMGIAPGWIVDYAAEVKKVVRVPVITVGRITDPFLAEGILASGKADLIAMGRGSLADPELPNKCAQGRYEDVRPCIGCKQGCLGSLYQSAPIRCLVNPTLGYEYLQELKPAKHPKRVVVVGGGPAGMEAARAAALAGHKIILYERSPRLGGQFAVAAVPPAKGEIMAYIAWAGRQLEELGVDVRVDTDYTPALVRKDEPDVVIVATGSVPVRPAIPGLDEKKVVVAEDVLMGRYSPGRKVVIVGGGMVGCETATFLASLGRQVTVIEMLPRVATDEEPTRRYFLMNDMREMGIEVLTETTLAAITTQGVRVTSGKRAFTIKADTVVLAIGMQSVNTVAEELAGKVPVRVIGDALQPRNALEAIREGFLAGAGVEECLN